MVYNYLWFDDDGTPMGDGATEYLAERRREQREQERAEGLRPRLFSSIFAARRELGEDLEVVAQRTYEYTFDENGIPEVGPNTFSRQFCEEYAPLVAYVPQHPSRRESVTFYGLNRPTVDESTTNQIET
jgi:hypothetical protein